MNNNINHITLRKKELIKIKCDVLLTEELLNNFIKENDQMTSTQNIEKAAVYINNWSMVQYEVINKWFNLQFINLLFKIIEKFIKQIVFYLDEIEIKTCAKYLEPILYIFKYTTLIQTDQLIDIVVIDYPRFKNRFKIIYLLRSVFYNNVLFLSYKSEPWKTKVYSISYIFKSANWLEREAYDLFGIHFVNHPDLRRILTDYGYSNSPFRKDAPLSGYFSDFFYSDEQLQYSMPRVRQELRAFKRIQKTPIKSSNISK